MLQFFFKSYFAGRQQCVTFGNVSSRYKLQNLGVVQGSKNGPLFWDIFSTDFHSLCSPSECLMYADDTCLIYVGESVDSLVAQANYKLELIFNWCNQNKLLLNPNKSEFMLISNREIPEGVSLNLGAERITAVNCFKYLGVHLDSRLKYQTHIEHVETKLSQLCGVAYRLKCKLNLSAAKKIYYACVHSTLSYGVVVWGGHSLCSQRCSGINNVHRRIVKHLFGRFSGNYHGCLFKYFGILKFPEIYRLRACSYIYNMRTGGNHQSLANAVTFQTPSHRYPTSVSELYTVPFPRTEGVRLNFEHQFVVIWNSIPNEIKTLSSIHLFKKSLTKYFLDRY